MVAVETPQGQSLVAAIKKAIDDKKIVTWSYTQSGDFTHTPEQWRFKAFMRPQVIAGRQLVFNVIRPKDKSVSRADFGVYQGRFIEMLVTHFPERFSSAGATASAVTGDLV